MRALNFFFTISLLLLLMADIVSAQQNTRILQPSEAGNKIPPATGIGPGSLKQTPVKKPIDPALLSIKKEPEVKASLIKNPNSFAQLDQYIVNAINRGAMPGCQIVALKDGHLILEKSYGSFNFNSKNQVENSTLYDIASVTKIASTTLAIMKLYEEGKIMIHGTLGAYVPETKGTNKAGLKLSDLLTHQAGLKSWIPFYKYTLDENTRQPMPYYYNKDSSEKFFIPIAKNLYGNQAMLDTVWSRILSSPLENKGRYVYSDLDLLFLEKVVENATGMTLDIYVNRFFFKPMGLKNIMYNPWEKGLTIRCAPTESDEYFRYQIVKGYVHDQGAAMLGGVAGHAGLFSNAMDLAAIMQLLLDGGMYNGKRYFKKETVDLFTGYRSSISRRGYGFDKPEKQAGKGGPAADICSKSTFGHQGFTGTCAWADPQTGIVFIMLANRVYPSADNKLFGSMNVRTDAQTYIYKALGY